MSASSSDNAPAPIEKARLLINGTPRELHVGKQGRLRLAMEAINRAGGCQASLVRAPVARAQILIRGIPEPETAFDRVREHSAELLQEGATGSVPIGCLPCITTRRVGRDALLVSVHAEGHENLGTVESVARDILPILFQLTNAPAAQPGLTVNPAERSVLRVACELTPNALAWFVSQGRLHLGEGSGSISTEHHAPARARDENNAVLDCLRAAVTPADLAGTALERDAMEHAARWGSYEPLVHWLCLQRGLRGRMRLPLCELTSGCALAGSHGIKTFLALGSLALTASLAQRLGGAAAQSPAFEDEEPDTLIHRSNHSGVHPIAGGFRTTG